MKIVIPDDYGGEFADSAQLARLEELGEVAHFTERPRDNEEMAERIAGAEIILTMRFQTDFKNTGLLDAARALRFISIWGTRPRVVDMKRAGEREISVAVTPGAGSPSVAEHTMMMVLALAKRLPFQGPAMRAGEWERAHGAWSFWARASRSSVSGTSGVRSCPWRGASGWTCSPGLRT